MSGSRMHSPIRVADFLEQFVADQVADRVVDHLEAVQVQEQDGERMLVVVTEAG